MTFVEWYDCIQKEFKFLSAKELKNEIQDHIVKVEHDPDDGSLNFNATSEKYYKQAFNAYKKEHKNGSNFYAFDENKVSYTIRPKIPTEKQIIKANNNYIKQTGKNIPQSNSKENNLKVEPKKIKSKSEETNKEQIKNFLSSNSILKKLSKEDEKEVIKFITSEKKNKRELYLYSDDELKQQTIDESNSDFDEDKKDEEYIKFGKIRKKSGMGNTIIFPQAVIPNASILSTKDMFQRIQNNYNKIKDTKLKNDEVGKLSCDIQKMILTNIVNNKIKENVKSSKYFSNDLSVYFPELITPFALIYNNQPGINFIEGAYEKLCDTLGIKGNDLTKLSYISYPTNTHNPLSDSSVFIKKGNSYYKIALSTKAGREGIGADASIAGLTPYLFDYNSKTINRDIFSGSRTSFDFSNYTQFLSIKSKELIYNGYHDEIVILGIFSLLSSNQYEEFVDYLLEKWYDKRSLNKYLNSLSGKNQQSQKKYLLAEKYMNEEMHFKDVIISLLNYGAYDFAQVNVKQVPGSGISESKNNFIYNRMLLEYRKKDIDLLLNNKLYGSHGDGGQYIKEDWHYEIDFKYPAVFKGDVKLTFAASGGKPKRLKFHIY